MVYKGENKTVKKGWDTRKNKLASMYYFLMIIFAITMILIVFGLITTEQIRNWWQENVTLPLP